MCKYKQLINQSKAVTNRQLGQIMQDIKKEINLIEFSFIQYSLVDSIIYHLIHILKYYNNHLNI